MMRQSPRFLLRSIGASNRPDSTLQLLRDETHQLDFPSLEERAVELSNPRLTNAEESCCFLLR